MKRLIATSIILFSCLSLTAQKYVTRTGKASFFSSTSVENIEAFNNEGSCVLDPSNQNVVFIIPIKSFKFDKSLMQDHFNDTYMESDKFPKADFKGKLESNKSIDYTKDGSYATTAKGTLTIHGVSKTVTIPGTLNIKAGKAILNSKFVVRPEDYGIKIPSVVSNKIAKTIEVTINFILDKK
jgi:hypothetical protein